jgi:hypothetical protein
MTHTLRLPVLLGLTIAAWIGGCGAADGGPAGTGITSAVVGNVVAVDSFAAPAAAPAAGGVGAIEVSIDEAPSATAATDPQGNFQLEGAFSGRIHLRFRTDAFSVERELVVPSGAVVALADIELSADGVDVQATHALDFVGTLTRIDCDAGALLVEALGSGAVPFEIVLVPETEITKSDGQPGACADLALGARLAIDGSLESASGTRITALRIALGSGLPQREPVRSLPFLGTAVAIDCESSTVVIDDSVNRTRLALLPSTVIRRPNRRRLQCADILLGDQVAGIGALRLRSPGAIEAKSLVVTHLSRPGVELRFVGFLSSIDCTTGLLQLLYQHTVTEVRLTPATIIRPPLGCADLRLGDRVTGAGPVSAQSASQIDAARLNVQRRQGE